MAEAVFQMTLDRGAADRYFRDRQRDAPRRAIEQWLTSQNLDASRAPVLTRATLSTMITKPTVEAAELVNKWSCTLAGFMLACGLSSTQLRDVFGSLRSIEASWPAKNASAETIARRKLILLKPKLRYRAARDNQVGPLKDVLCAAIDLVATREHFMQLLEFTEALVAHHVEAEERRKATHGGQEQ